MKLTKTPSPRLNCQCNQVPRPNNVEGCFVEVSRDASSVTLTHAFPPKSSFLLPNAGAPPTCVHVSMLRHLCTRRYLNQPHNTPQDYVFSHSASLESYPRRIKNKTTPSLRIHRITHRVTEVNYRGNNPLCVLGEDMGNRGNLQRVCYICVVSDLKKKAKTGQIFKRFNFCSHRSPLEISTRANSARKVNFFFLFNTALAGSL